MSCADCFKGGKATGVPKGTIRLLHGHNTYMASPSTAHATSTIILFTDAFGHLLPNNILLADALAQKTNASVLVPDIIPGGGMSPAVLPLMDTFSSADSGVVGKAWALARATMHVVPFLVRARPQSRNSKKGCMAFARAVQDTMQPGVKLGMAGYCWGGFQALHVGGQLCGVDGGGPRVHVVFVAHPARFELAHAVHVVERGVSLSFAHAAEDMALPVSKVEETKKVLEGNEGFELKVYEDCAHGFAVRATPEKEKEALAADEALTQAVDWFVKWL